MKLRTRYVLAVAIPLLFVLAATGLFMVLRLGSTVTELERTTLTVIARSMTEDIERRTENLAATAAHGLFNPVYHLDMAGIENIVRAFVRRNRLHSLLVIDRDGELLHDGTDANEHFGAAAPEHLLQSLRRATESHHLTIDGAVFAAAPIDSGGERIGWIVIGLSLSHVDEAAAQVRGAVEALHATVLSDSLLQVALIGAVTVAFGVFVALVAGRKLTTPIEAMSRYSAALAEDLNSSIAESEARALVERRDEIGTLARSFDTMLVALRHSTVSRRFLEVVLNSIADAVVVTDGAGVIQVANIAAGRLAGRMSEELTGCALADALRLERAPEFADGSGGSLTSGRYETAIRAGGAAIPVLLSHAPIAQGSGGAGCVLVVRNISDWKQAERELIGAKTQAEHANRAKSEFLAHMSHELRTPLNAIIGFAEIMASQMLGPLQNPRYLGYAGDIHSSGRHLLDIVNDVLDLAKLEAGKFELDDESIDLADVTASAFRILRDRAKDASIGLSVELPPDPPMLRGDRRLVLQMLINLVTNAVKFSHSGGMVTVSAQLLAHGELEFAVSDVGIGIAAEDMVRVLTPFGQANPVIARQSEGTGLGLPLTKLMVERHGGALALDSEFGVGTRASLIFPAERVIADRVPLSKAG